MNTSAVPPGRSPFPTYLKRWFDLSPAQTAVFKTLRKIPLGETRSYDDVARATELHPRQIGWLVAANHLAILIPCHRVVGKDGGLVGYGGGLAQKRWLLDHELRAAGVVLNSRESRGASLQQFDRCQDLQPFGYGRWQLATRDWYLLTKPFPSMTL